MSYGEPIHPLQKQCLQIKRDTVSVCEMLFKERIKQWRTSKGFRQKEAAAAINVPCGTFRSWEKGKREPNNLAMPEILRRMEGASSPALTHKLLVK